MSLSRSKRKTPVISDQQSGSAWVKAAKRRANRAVRKTKDLSNGKSYKKEHSSYDICDYKCIMPKNPKAYRK